MSDPAATAQSHQAPPATRHSLWLVLGWPVAVALLLALYLGGPRFQRIPDLQAQLADRPPLAILNTTDAVAALPANATSAEVSALMARAQDDARKLRALGYVVLTNGQVYAYPARYEVLPQ